MIKEKALKYLLAVLAYVVGILRQLVRRLSTNLGQCILCQADSKTDEARSSLLCDICYDDLPRFDLAAVNNNLLNWPAFSRQLTKRHYDQLVAIGPYQWPFNQWFGLIKRQRRFDLADILKQLLQDLLVDLEQQKELDDALICMVPSDYSRWATRGFSLNHMLLKAAQFSTNLKIETDLITKTKTTATQQGLSGVERRRNLRSVFVCNKSLKGYRIILLDDVITTGTTVNEISKVLKKAGAKWITVVTVCSAVTTAAQHQPLLLTKEHT